MTPAERMATNYQLFSPRHSITSIHQAKLPTANITEIQKPVATGSGVSCSIILAERHLFLSGFDHDGRGRPDSQAGTALLRGKLQLNVSKSVKIKAVQLKLVGRARTEWPEGIPPLKQDIFEEESLRTQVLTFFSALNGDWETEYGNQCAFRYANDSTNSTATSLKPNGAALSAKEMKSLSLRHVRARSFGKGETRGIIPHSKGHKAFPPGTYDYSFELPIDHHQLETTKVPYGSVRWELHATIERAGAFKPNLHGVKELPIVRLPDQLSLEMSEPISISRRWEDQLHYDIMVSGKSFPIGSKIPIAFKLTPLAKVRVHKIRVYISEVIEYWTNDRRVTRKDPGRKVLLLEKNAGKDLESTWAQSDLTTLRGGELTPQQRFEYREQAMRRNTRDAWRNSHTVVEPVPPQPENLLGDLELGLESLWDATEMEANVQIPTCEMMTKDKDLKLHPDCSWRNVSVFHWIKVVMRISRLDADDVLNTRRRHFEISIDSPLTILDCRATQANTILPTYSQPTSQPGPFQHACGCPDAAMVQLEATPNSSAGELLPAAPQAALTPGHAVANPQTGAAGGGAPRPIHLLRAPSFNPPAFDDDVAPPPVLVNSAATAGVLTPPPHYDAVVGTPSVDGLADYFSRLADWQPYHEEDSEDDEQGLPRRLTERSGRVNVAHPRTPGGHRFSSRSLELARPTAEMGLGNLHIPRSAVVRRGA
ncbi:putative arrestin-related trafficking adapter [Escovopsis weberi]|uniref:Putative arrestin-related trafficking adapter n=1 Tax=Escovopsis weberi TaxID=150374 RepID=A0A0M9VVC5_ESCWE|nr:putative arrestin-related trafficking adapter [Escovopsis weberi]